MNRTLNMDISSVNLSRRSQPNAYESDGLQGLDYLVRWSRFSGVAKRLNQNDRLSFAAIVTYGFASIAIMLAAAVSGFIVPGIMKQMLRDVAANAQEWQIVMSGIFQINQVCRRYFLWRHQPQSSCGRSRLCATEA